MNLSINEIAFGNPTNSQRSLIAKSSFLELFKDLIITPVPKNDSSITKSELNQISDRITDLSDDLNQEHLKRYIYSDQNLPQFLVNNLKSKKFNLISIINEVSEDVDPLIMKLKYAFNRPRPAQLAHYYKLNLFPYNISKIDTPSFPSRSVIIANLVCEIAGNKEPSIYENAKKIANDIASSRSYLGVNYASDIEFSIKVAKSILTTKEFTNRHQI